MIIEIVTFKNRADLTRQAEYEGARHAAAQWIKNRELAAKHFIRDEDGNGGAVYIWPSKEAAQRAHNDEWRKGVLARTGGNAPEIRYFELMLTADAANGKVVEYGDLQQAAE